jgi:hypothetical protein
MNKYILDQLEGDDKLLKFNEIVPKNYDIDIDIISDWGLGGTELLVYSFLFANAFEYWDESIDPSAPAGEIYIEMSLHDFVKVTGCSVQDIRRALQVLNEDRMVRVVEVNHEYGTRYAYHATT